MVAKKIKLDEQARERPPFTKVPVVIWVCAWCHVSPNTTRKKFEKHFKLGRVCVCVRALCGE